MDVPSRRPVVLHTTDGLRLVAELSLPEGRPTSTLVCFHPNPTQGGSMDGHVLRKAAERLHGETGAAVLRVNTRGTANSAGRSEGRYDDGGAERWDLAAALDLVEAEDLPQVWLLGWSFGSDVVLRHGLDPTVEGAVLLSPALRTSGDPELRAWADAGTPLLAVVPERDPYLPPDRARERFAAVPQAEVVVVPGAGHLLVGHADEVLREVASRLAR